MNYFISITLPEGLQKELDSLLPHNSLWKKVKPDQIHLTLRFIGKMDDEIVEGLKSELKQVEFQPFHLKLNGIGFFPEKRLPKVVWVGVEESKELIELQKSVDSIVDRIVGRESEHPFNPHITLARIKETGVTREHVSDSISKLPYDFNFMADRFYLIKSERDHRGAVHKVIQQYEAN